MFCKNCGAEIQNGEKFCGRCGSKIEYTQMPQNEIEQNKNIENDKNLNNNNVKLSKENTKKRFRKVIIIIIIIALLLGSCLGISNMIKEKERVARIEREEKERKEAEVFVPNLKEKTVSEAKEILDNLDVQYEFCTSNPGVDGMNFASTEPDAIVKYQTINDSYIQDNEEGRSIDKRYDKVELTAMTQEMINYKPKTNAQKTNIKANEVLYLSNYNSYDDERQIILDVASKICEAYNIYDVPREVTIYDLDKQGRYIINIKKTNTVSGEWENVNRIIGIVEGESKYYTNYSSNMLLIYGINSDFERAKSYTKWGQPLTQGSDF